VQWKTDFVRSILLSRSINVFYENIYIFTNTEYTHIYSFYYFSGFVGNFEISDFDFFGLVYNYYSIMHYSLYAYTRDGTQTMTVRKHGIDVERVGQRDTVTDLDVKNVRKAYRCSPWLVFKH